MTDSELKIPPGPADKYDPAADLFQWMNENFLLYGDIYKASVFGSNIYVVSDPDYCERILRWNWQNYPRAGQVVKRISLLLGNGLIASNGEFWASQRRMIQPAFTKSAIGDFINVMTSANSELLRNWQLAAARRETVNVTLDISFMVLKVTLMAIFGDDYATAAPLFKILAEKPERDFEFAQLFRPLRNNIIEIASQRRRAGMTAADILGVMMQARDREHGQLMTDAQLACEVMTLVVAGHETTAGLLNWIWYLLSRYSEVQTRLCSEFEQLPVRDRPDMEELPRYTYTRQVIDEALRLYPPLWLMTRKALGDDRLGEYLVPAGTEIYISPYLIQRNPRFWEVPADFDPDRMSSDNRSGRPELALCPFGAGPRNCIGELFARVEIQIHLMMLAKELRLHYDSNIPPEMTTGMNLLSKDDFIMRPEKI